MPNNQSKTEGAAAVRVQPLVKPHRGIKKKFAKYPSCFGKLGCREIMETAIKHGMEVITCYKPDMHCHNEVGLYGTAAQMKAVEAEWTAKGNTPKPRNFTAVFGVNLNVPHEEWISVKIAESKKHAIPTKGGKLKVRLNYRGEKVIAPPGYRPLTEKELPRKGDIAYHYAARIWEPVDLEGIEKHGAELVKNRSYAILRLNAELSDAGNQDAHNANARRSPHSLQ